MKTSGVTHNSIICDRTEFLDVFRNYATMPLRGMKERAKLLRGEAQWESGKGHGTTVTIHVPLAIKDSTRNGQKN